MISWLQTNAQKHFRVIFIVLLAVIIVAFVFTIGAAPGITGGDARAANLRFFDQELNSEAKRRAFFDTAYWSSYLNFAGQRLNQQQLTDYAFNRATTLHIANQHRIPEPNQTQLKEFIQELPLFQGQDGNFDPDAYARFLDDLKLNRSVSEGEVFRIIAEDFRIQKVQNTLAGPGFVLDREVLSALVADQTKWSIAVAEYDLSQYEPDIEVTDEALQTFYQNNKFNYATPPRRAVDYAEFKAADLIDQIDASEEELLDYYDANAYKYTKPAEQTAEEGEDEAAEESEPEQVQATFEEAREQVAFDYKIEKARELAMEQANTFALALVEAETKDALTREDAQEIANDLGIDLSSTPHFSANEIPMGLNWSRSVAQQAFNLSESQLYSEPILEENTALVLIYKDEIPETVPDLMTIRERLVEDYKEQERRRLRSERSQELAESLEEADSELAFGALAEEKGFTVESYSGFTRREPPEGLDRNLIYNLQSLSQGDVSEPSIRNNKAVLIYVAEKDQPNLDAAGEDFETRQEQLKNVYQRYAVAQYINQLTQKELARSGLAVN